MYTEKLSTDPKEKKDSMEDAVDDLFEKDEHDDEMESDGSASAFDKTETVSEDNFDRLSEK